MFFNHFDWYNFSSLFSVNLPTLIIADYLLIYISSIPDYRNNIIQCFISFVSVAPQWPRIEVNNTQVVLRNNISSDVGKTISVKCISRYGNPPARLKWFLGKSNLDCVSHKRLNDMFFLQEIEN